jgi:threonyl-tRNA synthetase
MKITLKDGSVKEFDNGTKLIVVAKSISESLAKKCVVAKFNDKLVDLSYAPVEDGNLEFVLAEDPAAFEVINHSCAHLMAQAVKRLYPGTLCGVGPAIEEGFYYDFSLPKTLVPEDLAGIEKEMAKIVKENIKIEHSMMAKSEALKEFANDKYKSQLIEAIEDDEVGIYRQGEYTDVCRGPHVLSTGVLKYFKLLSIAGAYWRGDSNNEMLTRIYGTCWFTKEELEKHLVDLEERKKRDHRKLGRDLGLFMISDYGPGLPFWLPNGYTLRRVLEDEWLKYHRANGYKVIETPIMLSRKLWETSGHWDHYHDDMYTTKVDDEDYAIKPMNCPGAILVYQNDIHSYKELPLRYAELGHVHRHEASGALNGLFRVRTFTQDDAHTLLMESQIGDEISRILKIYDHFYSLFGLNYHIELSTRPESNYIGDIATWDAAEDALKKACLATGHSFKINPGDGAFYGPKLDFKLRDSMNRVWQCGTVQLDMQLPGRFNCTYIAEDGSKKTPVMIHRACFGSLERFLGILIENYAGAFPTWLAPVQVKLIPVSTDAHKEYTEQLVNEFMMENIRCEADYRDEKLGYRLRDAQIHKIPFTLVIGDNEVKNGTVTYRKFGSQDQTTVTKEEFIHLIQQAVKEYK